jgi:polyisoprenoid-binding protein YceI
MRFNHYIIIFLITLQGTFFCQSFDIGKTGIQTFYFKDPQNRNQVSFTSEAPFETFTGLATGVGGEVSFDPNDVQNTIKGEISVFVKSIDTGIEMRDEELRGAGWLDAEKYPTISFKIEKVEGLNFPDNNKIKLSLNGSFSCHGKTNVIPLNATLTYLAESDLTKKRLPGDLLSVVSEFTIKLSDYGIRSIFVPDRISDEINITVNIVGTNIKAE